MNETFDFFSVFSLCIGILVFITGVREIITKKLYGRDSSGYTKESIKHFAPIDGTINVIIGISAIIAQTTNMMKLHSSAFRLAGILIVVLGLVINSRLADKYLVKK